VTDPIEDVHNSSTFDSARFRQVLGHFPTGVTVITAMSDSGPVGLAVGSFTSVSLEPPLVAFCPGTTSTSWPKIEPGGVFCVNVLAEDQEDVCRIFAGKGDDKFETIGWKPSSLGSPIIEDVLAWIDCRIDAVHEAGDHFIVLGLVDDMAIGRESAGPLVFYRAGYGRFQP
jgi:3-hydroxy-9,10-secoandrosta-1,3,5(10)-triene-9,17-dione monooxygenase reductase component